MMSNDEMEGIMRIVKSLEDSSLLVKEVSETIQNEAKEQKGEFLSMFQVHQVLVHYEICQQVKE